ncbi:hypothetical protein EV424DRAFT_1535999 [Suillus variegatus]|nr:hypothetical protein EV424DRAFT_1535999 [Suillus variegatus]
MAYISLVTSLRAISFQKALLPDTIAANLIWGLGRCPGRFVAEAATWIAMVLLLAATKAKEGRGKATYLGDQSWMRFQI